MIFRIIIKAIITVTIKTMTGFVIVFMIEQILFLYMKLPEKVDL